MVDEINLKEGDIALGPKKRLVNQVFLHSNPSSLLATLYNAVKIFL